MQRRTDGVLHITNQAGRLQKSLSCAQGDGIAPARVPRQELRFSLFARLVLVGGRLVDHGALRAWLLAQRAGLTTLRAMMDELLALVRVMDQRPRGRILMRLGQSFGRLCLSCSSHCERID